MHCIGCTRVWTLGWMPISYERCIIMQSLTQHLMRHNTHWGERWLHGIRAMDTRERNGCTYVETFLYIYPDSTVACHHGPQRPDDDEA